MIAGAHVLLVDGDVDALTPLATALRERGVRVALANGAQMACDRAKSCGYDAILASRAAAEPPEGEIGVLDALSLELASVPPLLVLDPDAGAGDALDRLLARLDDATRDGGAEGERPSLIPTTHALDAGPLADLLVVLAAERRSGALTTTTPKGSGEIRLVDGEVADAVYVRLEGVKAIARLLGERRGTATFCPGGAAVMRRINVPTRALVEEARRLAERAGELRERASALSGTLLAVDASAASSTVDEHVLARLRVPATLEELLDELPDSDAEILASAIALQERSAIEVIGHDAARVQLCGPDQLHLVRASAARARAPGFAGAARIVFAATPSRLAILGHTVLSLADAVPPAEPPPGLPVPHALATLRLGDGVELDAVALPLVPAYAPLWPMALAGAAVVVRLDEGAAEALDQATATVAVTVLDAAAVFGTLDESSPMQVATLVRTALESSAAG